MVAVLGDSFSTAVDTGGDSAWPRLLADNLEWKVVADAVDGSGYAAAGGGRPFGKRMDDLLQQSPDVILVAGGYHDVRSYPIPQVTVAADRLVRRLVSQAPDADVVLVSPFASGAPGPLTLQFAEDLEEVASRNDVAYVDATQWFTATPELISQDGVHPTDRGHRLIADNMEAAVVRLRVLKAPARD